MNIFKKTGIILAGVAVIGTVSSCKKLLVEEPRDNLYPTFFKTPSGIVAGITGVYNDLRGLYSGENIEYWNGTDEAQYGTMSGSGGITLDTYNGINSSNAPGFAGLWVDINTLNGVIKFAEDPATGLTAIQKTAYIAQAKFLRAFCYYRLVITFGGTTATEKSGIPLNLTYITEATTSAAPSPAADIYNQMILDLNDAVAGLPNTSVAPFLGKTATAGVAKTMLAKVYLTRGYLTEIKQATDFQKAADLTAEVIANKALYGYALWQDYADAHKPANDQGQENIFNIDYGFSGADTPYTGYAVGGGINLLVVVWRVNYPADLGIDNVAGIDNIPQSVSTTTKAVRRDNYNGRPYTRVAPWGPYIYRIWADQVADSRFDATFQTFYITNISNVARGLKSTETVRPGTKPALLSTSNFSETSYNPPIDGDTALLISNGDVTMARRDAFGGLIIEPLQITNARFPVVKKFDDPRRAFMNDMSSRPIAIIRFSELYLMNAEANYMLGNTALAAASLNVLRQRASFRVPADGTYIPKSQFRVTTANQGVANATNFATMTLNAAQLTQLAVPYSNVFPSAENGMDLILDEYSRELFGDQRRWFDLVRTRQLVRRVKMYKVGAVGGGGVANIQDYHMRRPIPQGQINAVLTGPVYPQNNGYN
jgi:hypothetical protein